MVQDQDVVRARCQMWKRSSGGREGKRGKSVAIVKNEGEDEDEVGGLYVMSVVY